MSNIAIYNPSAVVPNQVTQYLISVNTPDYDSESNKIVDPDLTGLTGIQMQYWKAVGSGLTGMDSSEIATVDNSLLPSVRDGRKEYLKDRVEEFLSEQGYPNGERNSLNEMYSEGIVIRPNQQQYISSYIDWVRAVNQDLSDKMDLIDQENSITGIEGIDLDEAPLISSKPLVSSVTGLNVSDDLTLNSFLNSNAAVTGMSGDTGIVGPYYLIELLNHRKELYNDTENPLYTEGHTPILGPSGMMATANSRVSNLETIHFKLGWHNQEVVRSEFSRPRDMLVYYGWLNSFNYSVNGWSNENVAQDMAKYRLIVFGDGVQNPGHGDYANTQVIISRIKAINPLTLIFGYVSSNQTLVDFQTKSDQWNTLGVHGIFLDESGYDFGVDRSAQNARLDYVHGLTSANLAFMNAWNTDHLLGIANDASYPNATYNPSLIASNLTQDDWILMESFPINTSAYVANNGYETGSDWVSRAVKFQALRATYGVNFAGVGIIANGDASASNLFNFGYISGLMWSLEAFGTSDASYGSSSATVDYLARPETWKLGKIWNLNATVFQDNGDADVYHRYLECSKLSLDFSTSAQVSTITLF